MMRQTESQILDGGEARLTASKNKKKEPGIAGAVRFTETYDAGDQRGRFPRRSFAMGKASRNIAAEATGSRMPSRTQD